MLIYALIDPRTNQVRYIGKTHRTAHRRLRRHLAPCYLNSEQTHKSRWLRQLVKVGIEPEIEVLEHCQSKTDLCEAERFHIAYWKFLGANLTNISPGGDGIGVPHTTETRAKIRAALTGKPKSDIHRMRSGQASKGRKASAETRALLSAMRHGKKKSPLSLEHRLAISKGKGGMPFVDQHGNRYETQKGAARLLGLNVGHLNEVLNGTRKSTKGYVFTFLRVREFPR